jgi:ubiquinol-cytochrome c reductase cytochrome c subunit
MKARRSCPVVAAVLGATVVMTALLAPSPADGQGDDDLVEEGRQLYLTGCSSCHGADGEGAVAPGGEIRGPSLESSGEASAYYYLSTGRMPLSNSDDQPQRSEPAYTPDEIEALVAFVASLGDGPPLPQVDPEDADLAEGGELFRTNCQACHSASGAGGALSYGEAAPSLQSAEPRQIGAAARAGPGEMPAFGTDVLSNGELDAITAYVLYLQSPEDPGGLPIGRTGPIPEGFVAWGVGMVALVICVVWIGTRAPIRRRKAGGASHV